MDDVLTFLRTSRLMVQIDGKLFRRIPLMTLLSIGYTLREIKDLISEGHIINYLSFDLTNMIRETKEIPGI